MLSLIYLAWGTEEPFQVSMRDLAKFNHVSPSVLCDSAKNEEEKQKQIELGKFREGSLTRLSSYGYITVEEIDGRTYITVHLSKMWEDNTEFRKREGVPNSNTIRSKPVRKSNDSVLNSNSSTASSVLESNTPVRNSNTDALQNGSASGSSDPLRTNNNFNERMKESDSSIHSSTLSQYSLEKVAQIAKDCKDDDIAQHQKAAQYIYQQQKGMSEDDFYGFLFHAEDSIKRHGPRDMQEFFWRLKDFLKQAR